MKYIKLFETHADYAAYIGGSDKVLPNVSYCEDNNEVHYNPYVLPETRVVATFNVTSTNTTTIYSYEDFDVRAVDTFTNIEIDGVDVSLQELDNAEGRYPLSEGEHIIKYSLINPTILSGTFCSCINLASVTIPDSVTTIGPSTFSYCKLTSAIIGNSVTTIGFEAFHGCNLTSVIIPNSVTSIGEGAFSHCTSLTSITIPNTVTSIGQGAFIDCTGLTSITSLATTAPTISNTTFQNVKTGGTLTVPSGSTGYNVWMNYLGNYSWSKVETSS